MRFTIDASVHINAVNRSEVGSTESRALLERLHRHEHSVVLPTLLLVEVAAAAARALDDAALGIELAQSIYDLPGQTWAPLDESLAGEAARLGAEARLRGADAVYAAVARRFDTVLVTRDRQQLERLRPLLPTQTPAEALDQL